MLVLKGEIGTDITAEGVAAWLERNGDAPFDVLIDSPGGSVEEMLAIDAMLASSNVRQAVIKFAASAASFLAVRIKKRKLHSDVKPSDTPIMIHNPRLTAMPKDEVQADDLRAYANILDEYTDKFAEVYSETMGISVEQAKKAMANETAYTPEAIKRLNIVAFSNPKNKRMSKFSEAIEDLKKGLSGFIKASTEMEEEITETGKEDLIAEIARLKEERDNLLAEKEQYEAKIKAMEEAECKSMEGLEEVKAQVQALMKKQSELEVKAKVQANANPKPTVVEPKAEGMGLVKKLDPNITWHRQMMATKQASTNV